MSMKLRNGKGKWLLRRLLDRYVPRKLVERAKMGFGIPLDDWLRGPLREWAESLLAEERLKREGFLDLQFYQTQYELLKSRSLAERVVEQLNLAQRPDFQGGSRNRSVLGFGVEADAQEASTDPREVRSGLAARLIGSLTVEPVRNSKLVNVHYDSPAPPLAAQIVRALAESFILMSLERRFEAASYAKNFLEQRLTQIKAKLEDSEQALVAFARRQGIMNVNEKQVPAMQDL